MSCEVTDSRLAGTLLRLVMVCILSGAGQAQDESEQPFNYTHYAEVLKTYVDDKGMVDYEGLKANPEKLRFYMTAIAGLPSPQYDKWDDKAKIAFWLNAYNGLTLKAIIDHHPIKASFLKSRLYPKNSIRQISGVWDRIKFAVMGEKMTLEHIEHKMLRARFNEPKIHMALVCAALSCPALRNEPYVGERLDEQLDDQTRRFLAHRQKFSIDRSKDLVYLSPIFKWFAKDFVRTYAPVGKIGRHNREVSSVLNFVAGYLDETNQRRIRTGDFRVKYLDYDWSLNERKVAK